MKVINQKFNILSALGIILVVGGHSGHNFISQFPVYSFHMPLFIFISGYFFYAQNFQTFLKKKVHHLLVPFLLWNAFYGILINWFSSEGFTQIGHASLGLKSLLWDPFTTGWPFVFNGPAWFVGTLFLVQLLYWGLHRLSGNHPLVMGAVASGCYLFSLYLTFHGWSSWSAHAGIGIERVLFCLIFYYLGSMYRTYLEKNMKFSWKRTLGIIAGLFCINYLLIHLVTKSIAYNVHQMKFFTPSYWLPLVVACTGICLYMQFAEIIVGKVRNHTLFDFIGRHTFSIMMHHQFFFWLLNTFFYWLSLHNAKLAGWFDTKQYMTEIYYQIKTPLPKEDYLYLLIGLCGPLLCCWIYDTYLQKSCRIVLRYIGLYREQ